MTNVACLGRRQPHMYGQGTGDQLSLDADGVRMSAISEYLSEIVD